MSKYQETVGFIIHQRDYSNSSLIIEFFSQDFGLLHILAKGIKNNKGLKSQLHYFSLIKIQFFGKSQLKTLASINHLKLQSFQHIHNKAAGLYLNELLHYSLLEMHQAESLFNCYQHSLAQIGTGKLTPILRNFEKELLKHNGFELSVDADAKDDSWLGIDAQMGLSLAHKNTVKLCQCSDLKQFLANQIQDSEAQIRINKLMKHAIDMSINHQRLYSRELLMTLSTNAERDTDTTQPQAEC